MNLDSMRVNIFKELMTLDKNNLQKLYAYILINMFDTTLTHFL